MRHFAATLSAAACSVVLLALTSQPAFSQARAQRAEALEARPPLLFEQNAGQVNVEAQYFARSGKIQAICSTRRKPEKLERCVRLSVSRATP